MDHIMMQIQYKGRTITIETSKVGIEGYEWTYFIDDGPWRRKLDRPHKNEKIVIEQAIKAAKREIDALG